MECKLISHTTPIAINERNRGQSTLSNSGNFARLIFLLSLIGKFNNVIILSNVFLDAVNISKSLIEFFSLLVYIYIV
jgi:hypothetical protein